MRRTCRTKHDVVQAIKDLTDSFGLEASLCELDLAFCPHSLGDDGAVRLANALRDNNTLTSLNLATQEGAKAFALLLESNTGLTSLNLSSKIMNNNDFCNKYLDNNFMPKEVSKHFFKALTHNTTLMSLTVSTESIEGRILSALPDKNRLLAESQKAQKKAEGELKVLSMRLEEEQLLNQQLKKHVELAHVDLAKGEKDRKHLENLLKETMKSLDEEKNRTAADKNSENLAEQMEHLKPHLSGGEQNGNELKDGQNNNMDADLARLDNDQTEVQNLDEIDCLINKEKERSQNAIQQLTHMKEKILRQRDEELKKLLSGYPQDRLKNITKDLYNNNTNVRMQSKKRKREENGSATDESVSIDSGEPIADDSSGEEPRSCSSRDTGLKVTTRASKRFKNGGKIDWSKYKEKDREKLKPIPGEVEVYFQIPGSPDLYKHNGITYKKRSELPIEIKTKNKNRQCIVCKDAASKHGNRTLPLKVMCAECAKTTVWWPSPIELN